MRSICKKLACVLLVSLAPGLVLAGPVNINTANAETLAMELTGIGPALAAAIVADREANGEFPSPRRSRVSGASETMFWKPTRAISWFRLRRLKRAGKPRSVCAVDWPVVCEMPVALPPVFESAAGWAGSRRAGQYGRAICLQTPV